MCFNPVLGVDVIQLVLVAAGPLKNTCGDEMRQEAMLPRRKCETYNGISWTALEQPRTS